MFFLFFLPSLIYANHADLFNQYLKAIVIADEPTLLKLLHENFTIFDCHGAKITDRSLMIRQLRKFPDEVLLHPKTFEYLAKNETRLSFKVNIGNEMINTYQLAENTNGSFVLLSENQSKCREEYESWYTTSLIDYEEVFKNTAEFLVLEYCDVLNGQQELETILATSFKLNTCNSRSLNLLEYSKQIKKLQGKVETMDCFEKSVENLSFDDEGVLKFQWNGTIFQAGYFEKQGKYLITSESLKNCKNSQKFLSVLIDDYHTAMGIAENISMEYYKNFQSKTLETLITGPIAWICDKRAATISLQKFSQKIQLSPAEIPKYHDEVVLFTLRYDFWNGSMRFFLYPGRRYPRIAFDVELKEEKRNVKLSVVSREKC